MNPPLTRPEPLNVDSERVANDTSNANIANGANARVANFPIPSHLAPITPFQVRLAFAQAYRAALLAGKVFKEIKSHMDDYLYRLCPLEKSPRFEEHCSAIERLRDWMGTNERFLPAGQRTISHAPKIPRFVLQFHVDENAYRSYEERCRNAKEAFFSNELEAWRQAKRNCQEVLLNTEMSPMDRNMCVSWWTVFSTQVMRWESHLDQLDLPDWPTAVDQLAALIEERVDLEGFWEGDI